MLLFGSMFNHDECCLVFNYIVELSVGQIKYLQLLLVFYHVTMRKLCH